MLPVSFDRATHRPLHFSGSGTVAAQTVDRAASSGARVTRRESQRMGSGRTPSPAIAPSESVSPRRVGRRAEVRACGRRARVHDDAADAGILHAARELARPETLRELRDA